MLTHVNRWMNNGWKRVSIDEAIWIFPYSVSSSSEIFVCELCGQFVTLTAPGDVARHFRHNSHEDDKNCPERTFSAGSYYNYNEAFCPLSLKVRIIGNQLNFQLGFVALPIDLFHRTNNETVDIVAGTARKQYKISLERFSSNSTTYISVGSEPCPVYRLIYSNKFSFARLYWSDTVPGIDETGAFFDKESGKRLPHDADVVIHKTYYIITKIRIYSDSSDVNVTRLFDYKYVWHVYEVQATNLSNSAAKFFIRFHARLTDSPSILQPIWPPCVQKEQILLHKGNNLAFIHLGNGIAKIFPKSDLYIDNINDTVKFVNVKCSGQQQLISIGRTNILRYLYLWESDLKFSAPQLKHSVTDVNGIELIEESYEDLPKSSVIIINAENDGFIDIIDNSTIIRRIQLFANKPFELDELRRGQIVRIHQGLDCVREIIFKNYQRTMENKGDDSLLYNKLISLSNRDLISLPHSFGAVLHNFKKMPKTTKWLQSILDERNISRKAMIVLKKYLVDNH